MKFRVQKTSDGAWSERAPCSNAHLTKYRNELGVEMAMWTRSFRGLSDLLEFMREQGAAIIIDNNLFHDVFHDEHEPEFCLEIYDDYRE
jgi:hypothetical protein